MTNPSSRTGRSGGVLAIGLFLLSCLVVIPSLQWAFDGKNENPGSARDYTFRESNAKSAEDVPIKDQEPQIQQWHTVDGLPDKIAQFDSVFWEPDDTTSLRSWLMEPERLSGKRVLEIGTGTGLLSLLCVAHGASQVVATDINPAAVQNASYNLMHLDLNNAALSVRSVAESDQGTAFNTIDAEEKFDLIISNPPWEDGEVAVPAAHALYDTQFALLDDLLSNAQSHLMPRGKLLLAYGATAAIERILDKAPELHWQVELLDERPLDDLPDVFLPGMTLMLSPISVQEE